MGLRIIHALTTAGDSMGVDTAVRELAIAQRRAGADVHLLVNGRWTDEDVRAAGVEVHETGLAGAWRRFLSLARCPTVLHDHVVWSPTTLLPLLAGRQPLLRSAISPHGCLADEALKAKRWKKRVAWRAVFGRAVSAHGAIVATSCAERAELRVRCPGRPVLILPNTLAAPAGIVCAAGPRPAIVGFLGRLSPVKGVLELVQAWLRIASEHPDWRLRLAGPVEDGAYADRVRAHAAACPSISIEEPRYGAAKWQFLSECGIIAVPSHAENFCLVVAESYLMGTPVLTTVGVPWPELPASRMGWRGAGDPNGLAGMLRSAMAATAGERAAMGLRGKAFVEAKFGHPAIARQSFALYDGLGRDGGG